MKTRYLLVIFYPGVFVGAVLPALHVPGKTGRVVGLAIAGERRYDEARETVTCLNKGPFERMARGGSRSCSQSSRQTSLSDAHGK